MKNVLYILAGLALSYAATGCKPTLDAPAPDAGSLNFSRYVAVGDYTTAGFTNGGLSRESQQTAYPAILAQQFATTGAPATFEQPYFNNGGTQMVTLILSPAGVPVLSNTTELFNFLGAGCKANSRTIISDQYSNSPEQTASLQNLGIPGLKIAQVPLAGLGNDANLNTPNDSLSPAAYNAYFDRIVPANDNRSYLDVVKNSKPTFFTLWLGMADVVNFAMNGGSCGALPSGIKFSTEINSLLDSLSGSGKRQGVIATIPSVKYLGFPNSLELQTKFQQQRNDPNVKIWIKALKRYNRPKDGYDVVAVTGADFITPAGLARLGVDEQVMVNGNPQTLPHGLSELNPLTEAEVLDSKEADFLESAISIGGGLSNPSYNSIITSFAQNTKSKYFGKLAMVNMQELYGRLYNGINYNGVIYSL